VKQPHWEHGWRCHGYWLGRERVGRVSLTPRCGYPTKYIASLDPPGKQGTRVYDNLRAAKRCVEDEYRRGVTP